MFPNTVYITTPVDDKERTEKTSEHIEITALLRKPLRTM